MNIAHTFRIMRIFLWVTDFARKQIERHKNAFGTMQRKIFRNADKQTNEQKTTNNWHAHCSQDCTTACWRYNFPCYFAHITTSVQTPRNSLNMMSHPLHALNLKFRCIALLMHNLSSHFAVKVHLATAFFFSSFRCARFSCSQLASSCFFQSMANDDDEKKCTHTHK